MTAPDIAAIAELCRRAVDDPPTESELMAALLADDQPVTVTGDPAVGVVATTRWEGQGYIRLLAVDPDHRRRGHGRELLAAAEDALADCPSITVGADAPYYLWPGVPSTSTACLCLLEARRYDRAEVNFNLNVDLLAIPPDPGGWEVATDEHEVASWTATHWSNWGPEALRAQRKGTLVITRDTSGITSMCAYDVNRRGLLGPVASRPDLIGQGVAVPALLGALHRVRADGRTTIEVSWVGPVRPYAKVGGTVGRTFFVYRKIRR
jgi:predicted N-acetyltransferase YhbS